jgi:hypothetical protein
VKGEACGAPECRLICLHLRRMRPVMSSPGAGREHLALRHGWPQFIRETGRPWACIARCFAVIGEAQGSNRRGNGAPSVHPGGLRNSRAKDWRMAFPLAGAGQWVSAAWRSAQRSSAAPFTGVSAGDRTVAAPIRTSVTCARRAE